MLQNLKADYEQLQYSLWRYEKTTGRRYGCIHKTDS